MGPGADARRSRERARLVTFCEENGVPLIPFPPEIESLSVRGNEHLVDVRQPRVFKFTTRNYPAGRMFFLGSDGRPVRLVHAFPSQYLERLSIQNEVFGDDVRLEAAERGGSTRIVTSQPYHLPGTPTVEEIHARLEFLGFEKRSSQGDDVFFVHPEGIIVGDEKPQNWSRQDDGTLVPLDLIVMRVPNGIA